MRRAVKPALIVVVFVLIAGILLKGSIPQPATGSWLSTGSIGSPRAGAASVLLPDGRILITGGDSGAGPVTSTEIFDTTGAFVAAPPMSMARCAHTATLLADGRVLVAGGSTGNAATNAAEIFDPIANGWTTIAGGMIQARSNHTASLLADGRVLFAGGDSAGAATASLEIFDPVASSFSSTGVMSAVRTNFASVVLTNGRVLLIGGSNGNANGNAPLASTEIFDPTSNSVTAGPALSTPRMSLTATTLLNGQVLVAGGTGVVTNPDNSTSSVDLASAEIYDPVAGNFTTSPSTLVTARSAHQAFLLPRNNNVLIVGGTSAGVSIASSELFTPWLGTFSSTAAMASARSGATGTTLKQDGLLLVAGGKDVNSAALASSELYGFATVKTDAADYPPGSVVTITGSGWQPGETVTLTLVESPLFDTHGPFSVVADSAGNISDSSFITDEHDLNISFTVTAVGSVSQAQTSFTDSKPNLVTVGVQSPNPVAPGSSAQFTVTVNFNGNGNSSCTSPLSIQTPSALPAGASASFSPSSLTSSGGNVNSTLTIATTNATSLGSFPFTVLAANGGGTCQPGTASGGGTLAVVEPTTTTLISSVNPTVFGQSTTLTATVAQTAGATTPTGGTVTFKDGAATLGAPVTLVNGTATLGVSNLTIAGNPHSLTASYAGVANTFGASTSNAVSQTVNQASTTTSLARTSGITPSVFGQSLTFTSTVAAVAPGAGTPTGNVTFTDGANTLATVPLSGSTAALTTTTLAVGAHSIIATYNADTNFTASISGSVAQMVSQANTTTTITNAAALNTTPSVVGQAVTINISVAPVFPGSGTPSGSVTVNDGAGDNCVATLAAGTGSCSITFPTAGSKTLSATYGGDTNFTGSTSANASHTVNAASTTTTITNSAALASASLQNHAYTVSYSVAITAPGGGSISGTDTVTVSDGTDTCTGTVAGGNCSLISTTTGAKTITAKYNGNTNYSSSTSAGVPHTVGIAPIITSANNTSFTVNSAGTFTVVATGFPAPTFSETGALPGGVTFNSTTGVLSGTPALGSVGSYPITITATNGVGSDATQAFTLTVSKITSTFSALTASQSIPFGQASIALSGRVNGYPMMTGTVTISIGAENSPALTLVGNPNNFSDAAFDTHTLPVSGSPYTITYAYSGDANSSSFSDTSTALTVTKVTPTVHWTTPTAITFNTALSVTQLNASFTAVVNGASVPVAGTPTYNPAAGTVLNAGAPTLGVNFAPTDTTDYNSASGSVSITVNKAATSTAVVSSLNPSFSGQSVTFTATVSNTSGTTAVPTGGVQFMDGALPLGAPQTLASGIASLTISTFSVATHSITAVYANSDGNFTGSTSSAISQVVKSADSTTSISAPAITYGANGLVTVTVTANDPTAGTPTGNVTLSVDGGTALSQALAAGSTTFTITNPSAGDHTLAAGYAAQNNFNASSAVGNLHVNKAAQIISFTINAPANATYNSQFSVAATASSGLGVTFSSGGVCSNAGATFTMISGSGVCSIKADQAGDNNYNAATQVTQTTNAQLAGQTITFTGAPPTAQFLSSFSVNASASSGLTVTLGASGACSISGNSVTMTSGTGTCLLTADQAGDSNYKAATQATQMTTALPAPTLVSVPSVAVTYDGSPKAVTPTLTPAVSYSEVYTGNSPTSYGPTSSAPTEPGSYSVLVTVIDPNYVGSGSGTLTINQKNPALLLALLTGMPEPSPYGTRAYFELTTANSPCPTGQVQFFVDGSNSASLTVTLDGSNCSSPIEFSTATLTPGTHTVNAVYSGDAHYLGQTSNSVSHSVIADGTGVTLATSAMTVFVGDSVTFTATVTPSTVVDGSAAAPSGTVQFFDAGSILLGSSPLSGNTAAFSTTSLAAGSHSITATYVSDTGDFSGSSSPVNLESVNKITPAINWPAPGDIVYGTELSVTQLNATATDTHNGNSPITGTFVYDPAANAVLPVGQLNLKVTFTPDDTATYTSPQSATVTINVTPATLSVTADDASRPYGANNPTFTFKYSGFVNNEDMGVVTTPPTCTSVADSFSNVGPYPITCSGGVAPNYTFSYTAGTLTVTRADASINVTPYTVTYDGNPHTATATATGAHGESLLNELDLTGTAHTNAGNYTDTWTFTDTTGNYNNASGTVKDCIKKADAVITVTPYSVTYDGNPHTATATAKGVLNESLSGLNLSGTTHTVAGDYPSDPWTFTDVTGNYNNANGSAHDHIDKANAIVEVTAYSVTYDANPHTAIGTAKGVLNESLIGLNLSGTTHTDAGDYPSDSWAFTDVTGNYNNASGVVHDAIAKANATVAITPYTGTYDTHPHALTGSAKGVGGVDLSANLNFGNSFTDVPGGTATWTFTGGNNYNDQTGTGTITINKADAIVMITPYSGIYDANPHSLTGTAKGVGGVDLSANLNFGASFTNVPGGTATWTFTGGTNYNDQTATSTITISARPASVTPNAATKIYGMPDPPLSGTLNGFVPLDGVTATYSRTAGATVGGSPYVIGAVLSPSSVLGNYAITYNTATFTITPASVMITASSGSMIYGGPVFPVMASYSGFVNGDMSGSLTAQPVCLTNATSISPVGGNPYISTCSGAVDTNYMIAYAAGSVVVLQATTTTAVVSSVNPSTYMQLVTFTATVSPQYAGTIPTGTVTFYNNSSPIGTGTLSVSSCGTPPCTVQATFSTASLSDSSPDSITASYSGDSNFIGSVSPAIVQNVQPAPNVSLSPMSVSFGNQNVNTTSKPAVVTLTNIGDAPLSIVTGGISITPNTDFSQTNNCGSSVAAGKSCIISITFTPIDTGIRTASLQITDNDDDATNAIQTVSLTGAGLTTITGGSLYTDAIFATANGCGSIVMSGGSTVDSFSSKLGYGASHQASNGNVGTNGNVTLNGSKSTINGSAAVNSTTTGNCSKTSVPGVTINGGAQVTSGLVPLNGQGNYPTPPAPNPVPPTSTQNVSGSCGSVTGCTNAGTKTVSLAPGQYGNLSLSGGTVVHFSAGTYNINSLTLSGQSILYVDSGPVVLNLSGASLSGSNPVLDATGGSIQNPTGVPANLQFTYAGSRGINLSGGANSYATVYAPNALVNMSGGTDFFGSIIASTVTNSGGTAIHYDTALPNIPAGDYIWFNAVVNNVSGLPSGSNQVKLYLTNSTISFTANGTSYMIPVPNGVVTFNSASQSSGAKTSYDLTSGRWSTVVAKTALTGNTFVTGLAFPVPAGGFPTGIQNVAWSASYSTDTPGITLQWQWGAAVYSSLSSTYATTSPVNSNVLGINSEDGSANMYGTDPAGTPEFYKASVTFGATGGGLTNYTGYLTPAAGVVPTVAPISVSPSSLNFGPQNQGTSSAGMTATLTNNDSMPHTISAGLAGISVMGSNAGDFTQTNTCPVAPAQLLAGYSCTITVIFTPNDVGTRTAKIAVNDDANNSPQTVYLSGTGQ